MHTRARAHLPILAVAAAVSIWGCANVLVKLISFPGIELSFYRLWLGVALMLAATQLTHRRITPYILREAVPGGILFGFNIVMFFSALKLTSVADATLISALQPALVLMIAAPWFGERVGVREVGWTAAALAGVAIVVLASAGTPAWSPAGDLLAGGAVVSFTGYFIVSKRRPADVPAFQYVGAVQLIAALVVSATALAARQHLGRGEPIDWVWLLTIVCFSGLGGHILVNWAHAYVDVSISSLMMLGTPVVGAVAAWIVLDESLNLLQIAGGLVTLAALFVVIRSRAAGQTFEDVADHPEATEGAPAGG